MGLNVKERIALDEMLDLCSKKFGEFRNDSIVVCESGCTQCSGGCDGHGMSIWTACDVK